MRYLEAKKVLRWLLLVACFLAILFMVYIVLTKVLVSPSRLQMYEKIGRIQAECDSQVQGFSDNGNPIAFIDQKGNGFTRSLAAVTLFPRQVISGPCVCGDSAYCLNFRSKTEWWRYLRFFGVDYVFILNGSQCLNDNLLPLRFVGELNGGVHSDICFEVNELLD